jgi:hypothetical protein
MAQSVMINPRSANESRPWIVLNSFMPEKIILILRRKFQSSGFENVGIPPNIKVNSCRPGRFGSGREGGGLFVRF